ncbi:MAG TPA: hypothetical protein VKA10_01110 [Prolixibacteraceae bacterium]|nr:hypothetical protein [Prolixibacteraceae bacterium]
MKTIILSDVNSKWESVIPYGLRVGRAFESEVDVVYIIDKRMQQGTYNAQSDSQSIAPGGNTLSQDEIIQREWNRANLLLDKLLSSEASRLNFPLKVNRVVKENGIVDELQSFANDNPEYIFIASAEPDNYIFESKNDIISVLNETRITTLLVPPRLKYKDIEHVLLPVDLNEKEDTGVLRDLKFFFERFKPLINAASVTDQKNYSNAETVGGAWKKTAEDYFVDTSIKINTLEGNNFTDSIIDFAEKNTPDLIIVQQGVGNFSKENIVSLLNDLKIPVLLYYGKK